MRTTSTHPSRAVEITMDHAVKAGSGHSERTAVPLKSGLSRPGRAYIRIGIRTSPRQRKNSLAAHFRPRKNHLHCFINFNFYPRRGGENTYGAAQAAARD
jgi:hypothetical protein